jgi:hypothetical protein
MRNLMAHPRRTLALAGILVFAVGGLLTATPAAQAIADGSSSSSVHLVGGNGG